MVRTLSAWVVMGAIAAATGCSMCSHPYDYCGPVHNGGCNGHACNGPRAGSIRAVGGPVFAPHEALPPEAIDPYYGQSGTGSGVFQPSSPLEGIVSPLETTAGPVAASSPRATQGAAKNIRQYLPAADRDSAQILSVTDETLDEMQARNQSASPAKPEPIVRQGTGTWTAKRPSATRR